MFAPLNGALLNGGASGSWGVASAEGLAEASVFSHVERFVTGSTQATATGHLEAQRTVRVISEVVTGEAVSQAGGVRIVGMSGTATAVSTTHITVLRTARPAPVSVEATGLAASTSARHRRASGLGTGNAVSVQAPDSVHRTAYAKSKTAWGVSQTWIAEKAIQKIRVNQQYASSTGIVRSEGRAIANSAIGQAKVTALATASITQTSVQYSATGTGIASATASFDPGRIQIIRSAGVAKASAHIAPTIIKADGTRVSYTHGKAESGATASAIATGIKPGVLDEAVGESETIGSAYLVRGAKGSAQVTATSVIEERVNTWFKANGQETGEAIGICEPIRYRWVGVTASPEVAATATCEAIRYRWVGMTADVRSSATATVTNKVFRRASVPPHVSEATTTITAYRRVPGKARATVTASASLDSVVYSLRYAEGVSEGQADSKADGLKAVWITPVTVNAQAAGKAPTFKINADDPAPDTRTVFLPTIARELLLDPVTREYFV